MTLVNYRDKFQSLERELSNNEKVELVEFNIQESKGIRRKKKDEVKEPIDDAITDFYHSIRSVRIQWESNFDDNADVAGEVKILPLEQVLADWKDDIYWEDDSPQSLRRLYHPVDFFIPEASAGILIQEEINPEMFFFPYEEEPIPLGLNFQSYIKLLIEARGFFYWQKFIISLILDENSVESERFKSYMPRLFPDFKISNFEKLFTSLQLETK